MAIQSFKDSDTEKIWNEQFAKKLSAIAISALNRLTLLDSAVSLQDLSSVRGNRLERLKGDREGQYSIRINDQYRICFVWEGEDAHQVEIVDYH